MKRAIICDLDGTLALLGDRSPYDATTAEQDSLNNPVANILEVYAHQTIYDIHLILLTGREERFRRQTENWLKKHNIQYKELYMRNTGDRRKDTITKRELYERYIKGKYDILFVLEDRDQVVQMWRKELGLTCLQVDYGDF